MKPTALLQQKSLEHWTVLGFFSADDASDTFLSSAELLQYPLVLDNYFLI